MPIYEITYTETRTYTVQVEADNRYDAQERFYDGLNLNLPDPRWIKTETVITGITPGERAE